MRSLLHKLEPDFFEIVTKYFDLNTEKSEGLSVAVFGFLPGLCSEILGQRFLFFSGPFLGKLCYVNLDSREKQEILPLKRKESGQKLVFLFSGENFVTPLWTFANNKRALPTNSTTADRLRLST